MYWEKTFDMIFIVPIFNFESRNSQCCYARNRELLTLVILKNFRNSLGKAREEWQILENVVIM